MSSGKSVPPLTLEISPSYRLCAVLAILYGSAIVSLMLFTGPLCIRLLLSLFVIRSAWDNIRTHALLRGHHSIHCLVWNSDDSWQFYNETKIVGEGQLLASSFVHRHLAVLNFRVTGNNKMRSIVLLAGNADGETLRRMRVLLKTRPPLVKKCGQRPG